ncbi:MAG: hypothetical protein Q8P18_20355 [Pseudomonadota bacterium]|nr:hypothetical protein [Pseudomonadota bacterium]
MVVFFPAAFAGPIDAPSHVAPSSAAPEIAAAVTMDVTAASHAARGGELIGSNCSYTTGMMARRVLEEGQDWSYVGTLKASSNDLASMVAVPYTVSDRSPPASVHVIANELIEVLAVEGHIGARLSLVGKLLEVDGVRYAVLTSFKVINA